MASAVCVISGGVGAARLLRGAIRAVPAERVAAIVNVGDDTTFHGLRVCPDLDTILYTLSESVNPETGWGLAGETWQAIGALRQIAAANDRADIGWFGLGDKDLGTHLYRTHRLAEGASLTAITGELCRSFGISARLLPITESVVSTRLMTQSGEVDFQDYFVKQQHGVEVQQVRFDGAEAAECTPDVVAELAADNVCIIAPSNPLISVDPVRAIGDCESRLRARRDRTAAISPLVGGKALKGPADRLMAELGFRPDAVGVAEHYREIASIMIIDHADAHLAPEVEALGMRCLVTDTIMADADIAADLVRLCIDAVGPSEGSAHGA